MSPPEVVRVAGGDEPGRRFAVVSEGTAEAIRAVEAGLRRWAEGAAVLVGHAVSSFLQVDSDAAKTARLLQDTTTGPGAGPVTSGSPAGSAGRRR